MEHIKEKVLWTIPYQPSEVDRHDLEDKETICWPEFYSGRSKRQVAAFRRHTSEGVMYEPIYIEFDEKTVMPYLEFDGEPDLDREEHELVFPLGGELTARAIGPGGRWHTVKVRPVLVRAELDSSETGIGVGYALCDVVREGDLHVIFLGGAFHGRIRQIVTESGETWEPFYYTWSQ